MADPGMNSTLLQQLASQYQTPQTIPAIQHSQYLAQALANLQDSTKNNIKTPTALWSSLLADGLLQYARKKSDAQLMGAVQSGQQAQQSTADGLMGLPTGMPLQAPLAPPQAASGAGGMLAHILGTGSPPPAPSTAPAPPPPTPAPMPMQSPGVPGMPTPAQVSGAFPGVNLTSGLRSPAHNAEVGGVPNSWHLMGTQDAPGALDLVPPHGMSMPQFASAVQGQYPQARIINKGSHLHVQPNMPNTGVMPQPSAAPVSPGGGGAPPAAAAPPAAGGMPQSAAMQPPPIQGVPTGLGPTPQEVALYKQYMSNPLTRSMGLELAQKIAGRQAAPVELNKDEYFTPDGSAHSVHQMQDVLGAPNAWVQRDAVDNSIKATANPAYGAIPSGAQMGPNGQISQMAGTGVRPLLDPHERAAYGISPTDRAAYAVGLDGKIAKTADDPFGPSAQLDYTGKIQALEPYKNYVAARQNVDSISQLMKQPGGFNDLAIIENTGKTINPNIAIRPNMIEQYGKEVGFPDWLTGEVSSVMNHGGHLTEQGRNALYNTALANLNSHWNALQPILGKVDYDAKKYGLSRQDLLPDLQGPQTSQGPSYPGASIPGAPQPSAAPQGATPPGWPVIQGKPLDPNSSAGKMATQFMARGLHYDAASGDWR